MPDIVLDYHRLRTPIDHPDGSVTTPKIADRNVTRPKLEDIESSLLWMLVKGSYFFTSADGVRYRVEAFPTAYADKRVYMITNSNDGELKSGCAARASDYQNYYWFGVATAFSTADSRLDKIVGGTVTCLAYEAVDLGDYTLTLSLSISGSTIKAFRTDMTTPKLTATDTSLASGYWGHSESGTSNWACHAFIHALITCQLLAPASKLQGASAIIELPIEGNGKIDDPFRPSFSKDLAKITSLAGLPEFLYAEARKYEILKDKGFTDEEIKAVFGLIQYQVDLNSVTWGSFELHPDKASTAVVIIMGDNPYKSGAIDRQKAKAKRAFTTPRSYSEAIALYNVLKKDHPYWLAGKENFAYQTLGLEVLDWMQNIDFYYGELLEHKTHYQQLKQVPDFEIRNRLNELIERLSKVSVLTDERDKHIAKAKEILKKGW